MACNTVETTTFHSKKKHILVKLTYLVCTASHTFTDDFADIYTGKSYNSGFECRKAAENFPDSLMHKQCHVTLYSIVVGFVEYQPWSPSGGAWRTCGWTGGIPLC